MKIIYDFFKKIYIQDKIVRLTIIYNNVFNEEKLHISLTPNQDMYFDLDEKIQIYKSTILKFLKTLPSEIQKNYMIFADFDEEYKYVFPRHKNKFDMKFICCPNNKNVKNLSYSYIVLPETYKEVSYFIKNMNRTSKKGFISIGPLSFHEILHTDCYVEYDPKNSITWVFKDNGSKIKKLFYFEEIDDDNIIIFLQNTNSFVGLFESKIQ